MKKLISILGSTGSIGQTTLKIVDKKKNCFTPYFFSANKNFNKICKQIIKYKPHYFLINNKKVFEKIKKKYCKSNTKIINTMSLSYIKKKSDITVAAIPGIEGLSPTLLMIKKTKKMLIANKESVICGWTLINKQSIQYKTKLIPVDSEHFSILQLIQRTNLNDIEKVYLTASGGPFLGFKKERLKKIEPKHALKHPKWNMGKKVTIDSSTLMNKILEYIEAQKLFKLPKEKLDILIHPESLVHAVIKFKNGLTKFIYHDTSMIVPISNAIFGKNLQIKEFIKTKNSFQNLTFKNPDIKNFPIIKIISKVNEYPSTSIIVNAANEVLVEHFLRKKVPFLGIPVIIKKILGDRNYRKYAIRIPVDLKVINRINSWAKIRTIETIKAVYD